MAPKGDTTTFLTLRTLPERFGKQKLRPKLANVYSILILYRRIS